MRGSLLVLSLFSSLAQGAASGEYVLQKQFTLGGDGGWDYLAVDSTGNRLFISRSDRVLVMNTSDGSRIATIPDTQGVHGIALVPDLGKGFTSNGRSDTVTVFDLKSLKRTGTIEVGGHNPDAIPATDGRGRIFFNIEDKSQIGAIDSSAGKLMATWSLANCEKPTGLALDVDHGRLFSVCANGVLLVTDASSGKHVAEVPIGKGPDAAVFDAGRGLVFSSNGLDGTLTVIHEDDPDHYTVVGNVVTQKSARTMALDSTTHRIYLVAAQFAAPPVPTADRPHPRPSVLEGSFKVLVVGN
jgi:DNA-binding beta-propeller fold protein YncE